MISLDLNIHKDFIFPFGGGRLFLRVIEAGHSCPPSVVNIIQEFCWNRIKPETYQSQNKKKVLVNTLYKKYPIPMLCGF